MNISQFLFMQLAENTMELNLRKHIINTIAHLINLDKIGRLKLALYD
jgi:hypothetical protein